MTVAEDISLIKAVMGLHERHWKKRRPLMRRLRNLYGCRFWEGFENTIYDDKAVRIQTADAYGDIESFAAALYSSDPAVVVDFDASADGNPDLVQACCNVFLHRQRRELERATRLALIYPFSFLKLAQRQSTDLLGRVNVRACLPWEAILDLDADRWEDQRWVGHVYWLTLPEAKKKFGAKQYAPRAREHYFEAEADSSRRRANNNEAEDVPEAYLYIKVVELWDLENDRLLYWSPDYSGGKKLLKAGEKIPLRTYDGQPMTTMVPVYYSTEPDDPLPGYSSLRRGLDQYVETNLFRTFFANDVRRNVRSFIYRKDALDSEELTKITEGLDGAAAGYEGGEPLSDVIRPIDQPNISTDYDRHMDRLAADRDRANMLASFVKGEATRATATEVTALATYSASQIGRYASERDSVTAAVAETATRLFYIYSDSTKEKAVVVVDDAPVVITPEALDGRFRYAALDQAATPISRALEQQRWLTLLPTLQALGFPMKALQEHTVRLFELPKDFLKAEEETVDAGRIREPEQGIVNGASGMTNAQMLAESLQRQAPEA